MNADPVDVALREIAATKRLLELLITSSESFDYPRAKATLVELKSKVRVLGKLKARLVEHRAGVPPQVIRFPGLGPLSRSLLRLRCRLLPAATLFQALLEQGNNIHDLGGR